MNFMGIYVCHHMTSYCFNVIVFIYITISLAAIITPIIRETFRGLGRMENVPQSRLSQCLYTTGLCVSMCRATRGQHNASRGWGMYPCNKRGGLSQYMRMCKYTLALIYPHVVICKGAQMHSCVMSDHATTHAVNRKYQVCFI